MKKQLISILIFILPMIVFAQDPADGDAVLPVVWKSFSGKAHQGRIALNWETASEHNAKDFVIEHSTSGQIWDSLGTVKASGNSITLKSYSCTHVKPSMGGNLYRLRQRDLDNRQSLSKTINIKLEATSVLTVLGNPVENGILRVRLDKNAIISLHDQWGRQVYAATLQAGAQSVDLGRLPKGYYTLRMNDYGERIFLR